MTRDDERTPAADTARGYDELAERADEDLDPAASPWGDSHFQAHYSWPATRELLPDVAGQQVLIAGCGRGDHVEWFEERGAAVVGVDASERAVSTARERFGDRATFHRADLTESLDFDEGTFDLVFSHLVLGHVANWQPTFEEFRRVLSPGGTLAFATIHPEYLRREHGVVGYYGVEEVIVSWPGVEIPTYYRPMETVLEPLVDAGFRLAAFEEPQPREAFADHAPERYEKALESPEVLCVRARVDGRS